MAPVSRRIRMRGIARVTALLLIALSAVSPLPALDDAALRTTRASDAQSPRWASPLEAGLRVLAPFSLPNGPYAAGHRGIDLAASPGDPVRSPAAGTVSYVGTVVDRPLVSIRVDAHTVLSLEPVVADLQEGDRVARGAPLGRVSSGGHCASGCLHLGVRVENVYVNPLRFLRARPVLLPWDAAR